MSSMTRLQGVNDLLQKCNMLRAPALDSSGTWPNKTYNNSDAGDAEETLDRACDEILTTELTSVIEENVTVTLASAGPINFASDIIRAQEVTVLRRRNISVRPVGANMQVAADGQETFQPGTYVFDVWKRRKFEDLPRNEQIKVITHAKRLFMQLKAPDLYDDKDSALDLALSAQANPPRQITTQPFRGSSNFTIQPPQQ